MKKLLIFPLLTLLFGVSSCKKESVVSQATPTVVSFYQEKNYSINDVNKLFASCNNFVILSFIKDGINQTTDYIGVKFIFCPVDRLILANDLLSFDGHYNYLWGRGNPDYLDINFDFGTPMPSSYWTNLEGRWEIKNLNDKNIWLYDEEQHKFMVLAKVSIFK
jgi:hypothetical protein